MHPQSLELKWHGRQGTDILNEPFYFGIASCRVTKGIKAAAAASCAMNTSSSMTPDASECGGTQTTDKAVNPWKKRQRS